VGLDQDIPSRHRRDLGLVLAGSTGHRMTAPENRNAAPSTATLRPVYETQDLVVDGCIMAMQDFSVAELTALAEHAEKINADGWLPKMIREYLNVWRAND
jgi:hypothetical protein